MSSNREFSLGYVREPRFSQEDGYAGARAALIDGLIGLCAHRAHLSRLWLEIGRCVCTTAIVGLHAGLKEGDRATWSTLSRLHATVGSVGLVSRNRIDNFVAYLERYGFIEKRRSARDRRVTLITPTERLTEADAAFLDVLERAACRMSGQDGEGAPTSRPTASPTPGPGRHLAIRREMMLRLRLLPRTARRHRDLMPFLERDSGCLILLLLLQGAGSPDRLDTSLRYDAGAELASVSRTHVRMLIEEAERAGLLTIVEPGGRHIRLSPRLWQVADRWFADVLKFFRACERRALAAEATHGADGPDGATSIPAEAGDDALVDAVASLSACRGGGRGALRAQV